MSGRLTFRFLPGDSILHKWDARCKFFGLFLLAIGLLYVDETGLLVFTAIFAAALVLARIPVKALAADMKTWGWFLLIIFLFQIFSFNGTGTSTRIWNPGSQGFFAALVAVWRLSLILCFALLCSMVTRPRDLEDSVIWLLRPFPFLPARRIGLMVSLVLRFLPLILDQAEEVNLATRARLGHRRKNPILRMKYLALPLLRRTVKGADDLALALAARGYREDLPVIYAPLPAKHFIVLAPLAILIAILTGWIPLEIAQAWKSLVQLVN